MYKNLINHSIIVELLDCTGFFITISNLRMNIFMHKDFSVNRVNVLEACLRV